jgi:hypothetical protein
LLGNGAIENSPSLTIRSGMWQDSHMKPRRRRLIFFKVEYGAPVAARCSVCHRPFEVTLGKSDALDSAHNKLADMFDEHTCLEDVNQNAARIVRETAENR